MKTNDAKKILSLAIDREVESYTFYRTVSDKVRDPALKKLFGELAGDEKKHREFLEGFLARDATKFHFSPSADYKVGDSLPAPALSADMKPIEGLVLAIKKELDSMQMYTQLAKSSTDVEQQLLFSQLANMETSHKARLEDLYTEMAFPESW
ncbi:MAG TPA: ferritin family protein [Methanoregula sp.]|nr:ferritin family protein [Methanoregula sp.]